MMNRPKQDKKRNPFLSFVLSLFVTGLGQLYNGQLKKGIIFRFIPLPIILILGLTGILSKFYGFIFLIFVLLIYKFLICLEAYNNSIKLNLSIPKGSTKLSNYVLFIVIGSIVVWYGLLYNREMIGYETFEIPTPSMEPSIKIGDKIMSTEINPQNVKLGDVVVYWRDGDQKFLCRVLGLPNQEIRIVDNQVIYNNGKEIAKKIQNQKSDSNGYQKFESKLPNGKRYLFQKALNPVPNKFKTDVISNNEKIIIPEGEIFVLGDNRDNSFDSRNFGTIPLRDVDKIVQYVWWGDTMSRIGKDLN